MACTRDSLALEKDVHGFPERVVKDLNHLLVPERIACDSLETVRGRAACLYAGRFPAWEC